VSPPDMPAPLPRDTGDSAEEVAAKPKRCFIVEELLSTEVGYSHQLVTLNEAYVTPLSKLMTNDDVKIVWLNLQQLIFFHKDLSMQLTEVMDTEDHFSVSVGGIISSMIPFLKMYTVYMNGFRVAQSRLEELAKDPAFSQAVNEIHAEGFTPGMGGLTLLMGCPLSRIPRYVLLLKDLKKNTPEDHPDFHPLTKALDAVTDMANFINETKRHDENQQRMQAIDNRLTGDKTELKKVMQALSNEQHDFEKHHFNRPTACDVCSKTIYGVGSQGYKCKVCKFAAHPKCREKATLVCIGSSERPTLVKHDRVLVFEGKAIHTRITTGGMSGWSFQKDLKQANECVMFFFNDSMLVCYPSHHENEDEREYEFVNMVILYDPRSSQYCKVEQSNSNKLTFEVTPTTQDFLHVFKCQSESECVQYVEKIQQLIKNLHESLLAAQNEDGGVSSTGFKGEYAFVIPQTIKINSRKLGETFAAYMVDIRDREGNSSTIVKRYSQFHALNNRLKKKGYPNLPRMPKKKIMNMDPQFVQKRCKKLEMFLNGLNDVPNVFKDPCVIRFLTTGVEEDLGDNADSPIDAEIVPKASKKGPAAASGASASGPSAFTDSVCASEGAEYEGGADSSASMLSSSDTTAAAGPGSAPATPAAGGWASAASRPSAAAEPSNFVATHEALYSFDAQESHEISVTEGEQLRVVDDSDPNWIKVRNQGGQDGYVPQTYVAPIGN